jgi:hypothetical protein
VLCVFSEKIIASIFKVERIRELRSLSATSILSTLKIEEERSSETPVLTKPTRRHIPEDGILRSHSSENLKSYIALTGWAL